MKILDLTKRSVLLLMFFLLYFLLTLSNISFADWEQVNEGGFGDTNNEISSVMSLCDGYLYVGTGSSLLLTAISGLWRSSDGTTWDPANTDGFGDSNNTLCSSMIVYDEYLYVGTFNSPTGCELWRSSDGTTWDQVNPDGFGDSNNMGCYSLVIYDDLLYAGTGNLSTGCELWRSSDGTTWDQANTDGFGDSNNIICYSIIVYDEYLYAGTVNVSTGCELWRSSDGTTWDQANTDGFGDSNNIICSSIIVYDEYLYAGTGNVSTGCELWRSCDGTTWDPANTDGFGDSNNKYCYSMIVYDDLLYAGTSNRSTGCEIWRYSESPTFTISGSVTGAISSYVPINLTGTDSQTVKTDSSGNYQFTGLASGDDMITPELEGYTFEPPNHIIKSLTSDRSDMDFVSSRAYPCSAEKIYGEDSKEVELLRHIRDNVLSKTPEGREIIKLYYQWSPAIVKVMEEDEEFRAQVKEMIDGVLLLIEGEVE